MADDNEHNLDHPPINNRDAYVIPTGMVPYIARVPGKFVAPGVPNRIFLNKKKFETDFYESVYCGCTSNRSPCKDC